MKTSLSSISKIVLTIVGALSIFSTSASLANEDVCKSAVLADHTCFQYGDQWGKVIVPDNSSIQAPSQLLPVFNGTFQTMVGGSGVLLGKFNDELVAATAYHTCVKATGGKCYPIHLSANFRVLGARVKVKEILGQWEDLDLVLFTLDADASAQGILKDLGHNFGFHSQIDEGTLLTVAGYSPIENPNGNLQITEDSDCKVLSKTNDFRLLSDPDSLQPDKEKKWAFATGCDVARGDSGGPVINRTNGEILGLVWTGTYPVDKKLQNSKTITEVLRYFPEMVWSNFAYVVPAPKLLEGITKTIQDSMTNAKTKETLSQLIAPK